VLRENRIEIGFRDALATNNARNGGFITNAMTTNHSNANLTTESLMLTGDENIVDVGFTVIWKVKDAAEFKFNLRDPAGTVRVAAESAMREVVGQTPIMEVISDGRADVQDRAYRRLQGLLDSYGAGITITALQLQDAKAPAPVNDAFYEVQRARADMERFKNEAEAYRNEILPKAEGEALRIGHEAQAYKSRVIAVATGDSARYLAVLSEFQKSREAVSRRLYLETMETVMEQTPKIIVDSNIKGIVPFLPFADAAATHSQQGRTP